MMQTVAIKIEAPNNASGNPRRGWKIYQMEEGEFPVYIGFADEGYDGLAAAARELVGDSPILELGGPIPVGPSYYTRCRKGAVR